MGVPTLLSTSEDSRSPASSLSSPVGEVDQIGYACTRVTSHWVRGNGPVTSDAGSETNDRTPQDAETPLTPDQEAEERGGEGLIFCGMCGALNPAGRYYCAACGTTLVDAFHATEGLRVYERPDSASRLIEIVPSGTELEVVEDPNAPEDFARVRLPYGRLGYIRLKEVEALAAAAGAPVPGPATVATRTGRPAPDINTNATGCISSTAALAAIALVVSVGVLLMVLLAKADTYDQGTILLVFCFGVGPFLLLTIAVYLYAKSREDRLADEEDEEAELA